MDAKRFDRLARVLTGSSSRRTLLAGFTGALAALAARLVPGGVGARNKRRPKKLPNLGPFGCQKVGGRCNGRNGLCCSGLCVGKTPKAGEKDKSQCVARNTSAECGPDHDHCDATVSCTTSAGNPGECGFTTGRGGYCFDVDRPDLPCRRDPECQQTLGQSAACVWCQSTGLAHCVGIQST